MIFRPYDASLPTERLVLPDNYPVFQENPPYSTSSQLAIIAGPGHEFEGDQLGWVLTGNDYTYNSQCGTIYYGYPYLSQVILPPIITRDKAGIRMTEAKKRLNQVIISVEGSCNVKVNDLPLQTYHWDKDSPGVEDAKFQAKAMSNDATIIVNNSSADPMDLNQAEWTGLYYKAGRRF